MWKNALWKFFFPLHPLKATRTTAILVALAMLIAMRLVLQKVSVYIPVVTLSISLAWTPLVAIGWLFGPVYGLIAGAVTDSLGVLISRSGHWFWLYFIQEPAVGLVAGLFGCLYTLRITFLKAKLLQNPKLNFKDKLFDLVFLNTILVIFSIICFVVLITISQEIRFERRTSEFFAFFLSNSRWFVLGSLLFFVVFIQAFVIYFLKAKRFQKQFILTVYITALVCTLSLVFSFLLGPISANEFYKYLHGTDSPSFIRFGALFYLIPRAIKEAVKAPVQAFALFLIIPIAQNFIREIKRDQTLKWTKPNFFTRHQRIRVER